MIQAIKQRAILVALAPVLAVGAVLSVLRYVVAIPSNPGRAWRVALAVDDLGNVAGNGHLGQSISSRAAYAAQADGQMDRARDYWRRTVEINPYVADYRVHLVGALIRAGQLDEARKHCEQILRLDPFNVSGRQAWVGFLLQQGQPDEARRAFDIIRRVNPPDLREREQWFRQQMR